MPPLFLPVSSFFLVLLLFFVPGWFLIRIFFGTKRSPFSSLETLLLSFAISIGWLDFLMITLGKIGIPLNRFSITVGIAMMLVVSLGGSQLTKRLSHLWTTSLPQQKTVENPEANAFQKISFRFSRHQGLLFVILVTLTILIKTIYLSYTVLPTATDLGHHLYWSKIIATTGQLPFYGKQEIITASDGTYHISAPQPIADFIVGEHLPFAAINLFSGLDFLTAFPVAFLLLINLFSVLALVTLTAALASGLQSPLFRKNVFTPQNAALAALFFFGPLYSLASPETKYVSGGVVGNIFGDFFIPLILLIFFRALREKRTAFLGLAFFLTFTLAYIHHLSTFILLFTLSAIAFSALVFQFRIIGQTVRSWWLLIWSPVPLTILCGCLLFFFVVAMPTYIETHAITTAIGTPIKTTRTGLSFLQIAGSSGEARVAIGLIVLVLLILIPPLRRRFATVFAFGWGAVLFIMTAQPGWLFVNIPSNRIGAYLSFPFGVLSALALVAFFASASSSLFSSADRKIEAGTKNRLHIPGFLFLITAFLLFAYAIGTGSADNAQTLPPKSKAVNTLQTFAATRYLAQNIAPSDSILKDHNYILADSWMKLFFLRDYNFPLSRGLFGRYQDNPNREQCTMLMIATPNTPPGIKCYDETGTDFVVVNPMYDTAQFEKSDAFSRIYANDGIAIYKRK